MVDWAIALCLLKTRNQMKNATINPSRTNSGWDRSLNGTLAENVAPSESTCSGRTLAAGRASGFRPERARPFFVFNDQSRDQ
jgi:hypothetical protein